MKTKTRNTAKTSTKARAEYGPDTEGLELSEINPNLTAKQQKAKDRKEVAKIGDRATDIMEQMITKHHGPRKADKPAKKEKKVRAPKAPSNYAGAAIPATKVWYRAMPEFRNCKAECWMLENDIAGTTTFANTYNDQLKASYDPKTYTYATNDKKLATKAEQMIEMTNPAEWPAWIVNAHGTKAEKTKTRKTK